MKVSLMYQTTIDILRLYNKEHPDRKFQIDGDTVEVKEIAAQMKKLMGWLYKDLTTDNIEKITRCYDCKNYKKYRKRDSIKNGTFYACSLDHSKRRPDFFCKDGEPREPQRTKKTGT